MTGHIHFGNLYEAIEDVVITAIKYAAQERGQKLTAEDEQPFEEVETVLRDAICGAIGKHDIVDDQCGIPDHRYCTICGRGILDIEAKALARRPA